MMVNHGGYEAPVDTFNAQTGQRTQGRGIGKLRKEESRFFRSQTTFANRFNAITTKCLYIFAFIIAAFQQQHFLFASSFNAYRSRRISRSLGACIHILGSTKDIDEPMIEKAPMTKIIHRRVAINAMFMSGAAVFGSRAAHATAGDELENLLLGDGKWTDLSRQSTNVASTCPHVLPEFVTYATRFLIHYDPSAQSWWSNLERSYSLLSKSERRGKLRHKFGSMAKSLELSIASYLLERASPQQAYELLWDRFTQQYGHDRESRRQIALLFALLPAKDQPVSRLRSISIETDAITSNSPQIASTFQMDVTGLLPLGYKCIPVADASYFTIYPAIGGEFGLVAKDPLTRDQADYSVYTYARLGLSGAVGCALTHAFVIPIDVTKTRTQIDSEQYKGFLNTGRRILREEGAEGLFLGAQATLLGYLWYGASVYPCYTFFKRLLTLKLLPEDVVAANSDGIAILAGALASIVASLLLTPIEAARIRVVANPEKYRALGLAGTLRIISNENPSLGWQGAYSGFSSLLTRQVIFGSVKFIAFERACAFLYSIWPSLQDETWTSLIVSLCAGAFSGALSAVVSQPADAVLTLKAQDTEFTKQSLWSTGMTMVRVEGLGRLFRGVGSRSIWATCIIAGQFLLYDAFRACAGVSPADLTQVYQLMMSPAAFSDSP